MIRLPNLTEKQKEEFDAMRQTNGYKILIDTVGASIQFENAALLAFNVGVEIGRFFLLRA